MRTSFSLIVLGISLLLPVQAQAKINIFACEPEYAALAKEITAEQANIFSATTAKQDPHFVQARPSLIAKMRKADLVICAGAELETGWLPMLQMKSHNRKVQSTKDGLFYASDHVTNLDIPEKVDASMGDVHALGNPHVHLDPRNILPLAKAITNKLAEITPNEASNYQQNYQKFEDKWQKALVRWQSYRSTLKGTQVIGYHTTFRYLFDYLDIEQVGDLEPKPGLPPTSHHLAALVKLVNEQQVPLVVYSAYQNSKGVNWLTSKTAITALQLPYTIGGDEKSTDLISLFDQHFALLLNSATKK